MKLIIILTLMAWSTKASQFSQALGIEPREEILSTYKCLCGHLKEYTGGKSSISREFCTLNVRCFKYLFNTQCSAHISYLTNGLFGIGGELINFGFDSTFLKTAKNNGRIETQVRRRRLDRTINSKPVISLSEFKNEKRRRDTNKGSLSYSLKNGSDFSDFYFFNFMILRFREHSKSVDHTIIVSRPENLNSFMNINKYIWTVSSLAIFLFLFVFIYSASKDKEVSSFLILKVISHQLNFWKYSENHTFDRITLHKFSHQAFWNQCEHFYRLCCRIDRAVHLLLILC